MYVLYLCIIIGELCPHGYVAVYVWKTECVQVCCVCVHSHVRILFERAKCNCRGDPFDTCGSAPCTNAGMSSLLNPNSVIPF